MIQYLVNVPACCVAFFLVVSGGISTIDSAKANIWYESGKAGGMSSIFKIRCGFSKGPKEQELTQQIIDNPKVLRAGSDAAKQASKGGQDGKRIAMEFNRKHNYPKGLTAEIARYCQRIYDKYGPSGTVVKDLIACTEYGAPPEAGPCKE